MAQVIPIEVARARRRERELTWLEADTRPSGRHQREAPAQGDTTPAWVESLTWFDLARQLSRLEARVSQLETERPEGA